MGSGLYGELDVFSALSARFLMLCCFTFVCSSICVPVYLIVFHSKPVYSKALWITVMTKLGRLMRCLCTCRRGLRTLTWCSEEAKLYSRRFRAVTALDATRRYVKSTQTQVHHNARTTFCIIYNELVRKINVNQCIQEN